MCWDVVSAADAIDRAREEMRRSQAKEELERRAKEAGRTLPEKVLAAMMARDLGVTVEPRTLRLFLQARWSKVSALAHRIHEDGADDEAR